MRQRREAERRAAEEDARADDEIYIPSAVRLLGNRGLDVLQRLFYERITAEAEGMRLGSVMLDPFVAILDDAGATLAARDDGALHAQDPVVSVIASSEDDWDRYETLHWRACEEWLATNPDDPDAAELGKRHLRSKHTYLRHGREYLGWAIFIGWKPDGPS